VDRTTKSHTSFNSRVKNVKLLIGTIAHEANISVESAARLGEIDPLKVCQKDEDAVRELLWALVRIGILHRIQRSQGLPENLSPRKRLTLHQPLGVLNTTSRVSIKESCEISGESRNALSILHKSLERRRELAGMQSVNPRTSHGPLKTYNWLEDLPSSFSTLSNINDSTNDPATATQPRKQTYSQQTLPKVSRHALAAKSIRRASVHSTQPSVIAPKCPPLPLPKSSKTQTKPTLQKPTSRKSSQTLKPNSYPHAVYHVSFDEMPTESAEISPVSTVYLEHVSARVMEISNRILPVARMSQPPDIVLKHVVSPKPVSLPPQEHSRTVSPCGSSRTVMRLKKGSGMSLKTQGNIAASATGQKRGEVIPIVQATLCSNSFIQTVVPIPLENPLDHTQDASTVELQPTPDAPLSAYTMERGAEVDETICNLINAGGTMSARSTVEDISGVTEEYEERDSELKQSNLLDETHDTEDYTSDEDQPPTRPSGGDQTAREGGAHSPVWGGEAGGLTADTQLREDSQPVDPRSSVDIVDPLERHGHNSAASLEVSLATPLTANGESSQKNLNVEQDLGSVPNGGKSASHVKENPVNAVGIDASNQQPELLLINVTQSDIPTAPPAPAVAGNLIDLLSDPIPISLPPVLCTTGLAKSWISVPRDLRSESRDGAIDTPPTRFPSNNSHLLLGGFDLSSPIRSSVLQTSEGPACAVPLPESEVSSFGSSSVSSIVVHQGTQTDASAADGGNNSPNGILSSGLLDATEKGKHRESDNNTGSSPLLGDVPVSPARSESPWTTYYSLQPNGKKSPLGGVFTSTPKQKKPTPKYSDPSMNHGEVSDEDKDEVVSNAVGNISLLDADTELDELSRELSAYHIASCDRSLVQSPSPLRRSVRSGKGSPGMQGTESKLTTTPPRRPDTPTTKPNPTKLNPNSASSLDAASSTWETEDDDLEQKGEEEKAEGLEQPSSKGSNPLEWCSDSPTAEDLHKRQMQQMQSIIQNWDQAGSSQPLQDKGEFQYIPDDSDNVADDEEDETFHEQGDEEAEYTTTSASQFSNGAGLEDVFADEPETPVRVARHKQSQKNRDSRQLNLSPPPRWSGFGLFHEAEPQTPFTPLRPRKLFSMPVLGKAPEQAKVRRESRSLVLERSPRLQGQEVGNRSLPTTFPPTSSLSPTPVLSKSLNFGRHNRIGSLVPDKPCPAALFDRPAPPAGTSTKPSTPVNPNTNLGNTSLPPIPPWASHMSKMNSRKSSISTSTPLQARNISLSSIQSPPVVSLSKFKSKGTLQGTPYYTPPSGVKPGGVQGTGSMGRGGGRDVSDLLDMDLSYGLM